MRQNSLLNIALCCLFISAAPVAMAASGDSATATETDLHAAVRTALAHTPGQVLEAEHERENGKKMYEIDIVNDSKITEVTVDASTGKVTKAETDDIKHRVKEFFISSAKLDALKQAKISLTDAIAKVEDETKGKAVEANFEREGSRYVYEIKLKEDDKCHKALVDVESGAVETKC